MLRTQVSLDPEMYERARAEAARLGVSIAELVRRALATQLAAEAGGRRWMRFAGVLASGDSEASRTVDEVVYRRGRP